MLVCSGLPAKANSVGVGGRGQIARVPVPCCPDSRSFVFGSRLVAFDGKIASFRFEDEDENEDQVQLLLIVGMLKSVTGMA